MEKVDWHLARNFLKFPSIRCNMFSALIVAQDTIVGYFDICTNSKLSVNSKYTSEIWQ